MYRTTLTTAGSGLTIEPKRAGTPTSANGDVASWYSKVASAWGAALDRQAAKTVQLSQELNSGDAGPGTAMLVSAAAHQLTFLSTAASNVSNSIGEALQTLGRRQ
jgi:hypothetical protein